MDWFTDRLRAERAARESDSNVPIPTEEDLVTFPSETIRDMSVYKCTPFTRRSDASHQQDEVVNDEMPTEGIVGGVVQVPEGQGGDGPTPEGKLKQQSLIFDSEFECGNLDTAVRVLGREGLLRNAQRETQLSGESPCQSETPGALAVHQEYDLRLCYDMFTTGNIQWYFFGVTAPPPSPQAPSATPSPCPLSEDTHLTYPLTVRFNITNMMKSDALYNYGCRPATYSHRAAEVDNIGWTHAGFDVCYYKNDTSFVKKSKDRTRRQHHYTLSFSYTFQGPDTVYFAHCFPYTYTRLQNYLLALERDTRIATFIRRKMLCCTLANNRCDLLTITAPSQNPTDMDNRPGVVITARVHPGESNSSFVMEGLLDFLTSEHPEAVILRATYVIKVVPMLNPDGVIHGNYRCSLAGCDLNRKYMGTDSALHPTIYAVKEVISELSRSRGVALYLDIHGHSQRKNVFLYGCDPNQSNVDKIMSAVQMLSPAQGLDRSVFSRIFPKILVSTSTSLAQSQGKDRGYFSFEDSALGIQKSKTGTGRVVTWRNAGVSAAYTVEISFCGNGNNAEVKLIKTLAAHYNKRRTRLDHTDNSLNYYRDHLLELGSNTKWSAALCDILQAYGTTAHYTESDLLNMGTEICLAIHAFANLGGQRSKGLKEYILRYMGGRYSTRPSSASASPRLQRSFTRRVTDADTNRIPEERSAVKAALLNQDKSRNAINGIQEIMSAADILEPILHPAVVNVDVLGQLMSHQHVASKVMHQLTTRLLCEIELRREFRMLTEECSTPISMPQTGLEIRGRTPGDGEGKEGEDTNTMGVDVEYDDDALLAAMEGDPADDSLMRRKLYLYDINEDVGSDSDPSGDEALPSNLAKSAVFIHLARFSKHDIAKRLKLARKKNRSKKNKWAAGGMAGDGSSSSCQGHGRGQGRGARDFDNASPKNVKSRYRNGSLAPHRQAIAESLALNRLALQQAQQQALQQPVATKKIPPTVVPAVVKQPVRIRNVSLIPEGPPKGLRAQQALMSGGGGGGGAPKAHISSPAAVMGKNYQLSLPESLSSPALRLSVPSSTPPPRDPSRRDPKPTHMSQSVSDGDLTSMGQYKRYVPSSNEHVVVKQQPAASRQTSLGSGVAARNVVTVGDIASAVVADAPNDDNKPPQGGAVATRKKGGKPVIVSSPALCGIDPRVSRISPPSPVFESPKRRAFLNNS